MTACVNRKHTKKVAAVVTASLVGALSLGVAPVAAVADTGIETLAVNWATGASITKANDGKGASVSNPSRATFAKGSNKFLVPTEVKNDFATTYIDEDSYDIYYYTTSTGGTPVAAIGDPAYTDAYTYFSADANCSGVYYVEITDGTDTMNRVAFKYVSGENALNGAYAYTVDPENPEIVYNGSSTFNSVKFADSEGYELTGATVSSWTDAAGNPVANPADVMNAGAYTAAVSYTDATGTYNANIKVTVSALDLSTASIAHGDFVLNSSVADQNAELLDNLEINGKGAVASGFLKVTSVVAPDGSTTIGASGSYTVTVAGTDTAVDAGNVKGSSQVKFNIIDNDVFGTGSTNKVRYNRTDITGTGSGATGEADPFDIYLTDGEAFDASKIKVTDNGGKTLYSGDELEFSYSDGSKAVDASALTKPGTYAVTVRIKPVQDFATDDWTGGSKTVYVRVRGAEVDANETVAFYLDGELAGSRESVTYDGHDFLENITAVVKDADGTAYEEGTDYTLEVTKGGKKVDAIVDADASNPYTVTIEPITFQITSGTKSFDITVSPVKFNQLVPVVDSMEYNADKATGNIMSVDPDNDGVGYVPNTLYVPYTGSAIAVPAVKYGVQNSTTLKWTYYDLSSDLYNVVSIKKDGAKVNEIKDEGDYEVKIALSDAASGNYSVNGNDTFEFTVREFGHFADVQPDAWYAVAVEKAYDELYINGIANTNLFAPEADITRADAVCILYNMAGGDTRFGGDDFRFDEDHGYNTGFSDVDGHAYFAKALAWAHASGVANGSNGEFRPYDQITREEFASLLANFAKSKGEYVAAGESALDGMSDASSVSDWAKDNVAWAVENGVMGNGGFVAAQDNIIRAEVAAMAVNYQPENLTGEVRPAR